MQTIQHYVLFPNHDNGMRLYQELKKLGVRATIAPTPRAASKCCGISLLVKEEDIPFLAESAYADACRPGNPKGTSVEDITELFQSLI